MVSSFKVLHENRTGLSPALVHLQWNSEVYESGRWWGELRTLDCVGRAYHQTERKTSRCLWEVSQEYAEQLFIDRLYFLRALLNTVFSESEDPVHGLWNYVCTSKAYSLWEATCLDELTSVNWDYEDAPILMGGRNLTVQKKDADTLGTLNEERKIVRAVDSEKMSMVWTGDGFVNPLKCNLPDLYSYTW